MTRLRHLLKPSWPRVLLFLSLICLIPVRYVWREPLFAFTNRHWIWRYRVYESLFRGLTAGRASSLDVFIGMVVRDYLRNFIGPPLLLVYWLASCTVCACLDRLLHCSGLKRATSASRDAQT